MLATVKSCVQDVPATIINSPCCCGRPWHPNVAPHLCSRLCKPQLLNYCQCLQGSTGTRVFQSRY